ncbi:MAG TPA: nucleotide exchange factor GrpE [Vicinamibacteria bacterium]
MDEHDSTSTEGADTAVPTSPTTAEHGLEAAEAEETAGLAPVEPAGSLAPSEIEALRSELEEVQDLLRRKQADFDNYRKRIEREQKEFVAYAASELVLEILPVLDNLERALESSPTGSPDQIRQGVEIIYRQLNDTLKKAGLREVDALGEDFDPHVHEAVARVDSPDHREGEVLEVLQKGYFLKDRLLRPAMVRVGHNPALAESDEESESPGESDERGDIDAPDHPNSDV